MHIFSVLNIVEGETSNEEGSDYEENVHKLIQECSKDPPKNSKLKRLVRATFKQRRQWILRDTPKVSEVLEVFPPLRQSARVRV